MEWSHYWPQCKVFEIPFISCVIKNLRYPSCVYFYLKLDIFDLRWNFNCRRWKSWFARLRFSFLLHIKDGPEKLIFCVVGHFISWVLIRVTYMLFSRRPFQWQFHVAALRLQMTRWMTLSWNTLNRCICNCPEYGWLKHSENIASFYSPGIFSPKVGQPATNCERRFFNGFWSRNMSSRTYQKSPKIRVGEVDEKRFFLKPYKD